VRWGGLHAEGRKSTPVLLDHYGDEQASAFSALLEKAETALAPDGGPIDWSSPATVIGMRKVFDEFAAVYDGNPNEWGRWIAASLRLFARLPLWRRGIEGPAFYPAARLPASSWLEKRAKAAVSPDRLYGSELWTAVSRVVVRHTHGGTDPRLPTRSWRSSWIGGSSRGPREVRRAT
jgi:hypothetical protein